METTCLAEPKSAQDIRLTEEEVVALMINLIAFEGDWEAHLEFLEGLEGSKLWEYEQLPLVRELQRKDREFDIQNDICLES